MEKIKVGKKEKIDDEWIFDVEIGETRYEVAVPMEYWEKLTGGKIEPEELVQKSFEFLIAREPKESILKEFELSLIQKYFPEYEKKICEMLK